VTAFPSPAQQEEESPAPEESPLEEAPLPEPAVEMPEFFKVTEVNEGQVVLGAGTLKGFTFGRAVRIFRPLVKPDAKNLRATHELMAVVRIERAEEHESYAFLGRGEEARAGDLIDITVEPVTASYTSPHRARFNLRGAFYLRPVMGSDFGMLLGGMVAYRPEDSAFVYSVSLEPLSLGLGIAPALRLTASAAWSMTFFELGAGLSVMPGPNCGGFGGCSPVTIAVVPSLRVGGLDGIHLGLAVGLSTIPAYGGLFPVSLDADVNLPVARNLEVFAKAAVGIYLEQSFSAGARLFTLGVGDAGTVIYSVGVGASNVVVGNTLFGFGATLGAEFRL